MDGNFYGTEDLRKLSSVIYGRCFINKESFCFNIDWRWVNVKYLSLR